MDALGRFGRRGRWAFIVNGKQNPIDVVLLAGELLGAIFTGSFARGGEARNSGECSAAVRGRVNSLGSAGLATNAFIR